MAYIKNTWVDQSVERPKTYEMTNNADGSVTLIDSFGLVSELGTPVNADNMNHIEEGLSNVGTWIYNPTETYSKSDWVLGTIDNKKSIFESLIDNNQDNPLVDTTKWKKVSLGGINTEFFGKSFYSEYCPNSPCLLLSNNQENLKSLYPSLYNWVLENVNKGTAGFKGLTGYYYCNTSETFGCFVATTDISVGAAVYHYYKNVEICSKVEEIVDNGFIVYDRYNNVFETVIRDASKDITSTTYPQWHTDYDFIIDAENEKFRLPLLDGSENLPGDSKITIKSSGFQASEKYVAPKNGVYTFRGYGANPSVEGQLWILNTTSGTRSDITLPNNIYGSVNIEVKKGDIISIANQNIYPVELYFSAHKNRGKLYYYCGNEVENEDKIDIGQLTQALANKADKSEIDGKWIDKYLKILPYSSNNIPANFNTTYDLSQYLPNDNNLYKVKIRGYIETLAINNISSLSVCSSALPFNILFIKCGGAAASSTHGTVDALVGIDRKLTLFSDSAVGVSQGAVDIIAYRKVR